jgi:diaminopimelate epimerase
MQKIRFIKMVASGNDFVIVDKVNYRLPITDYRLPKFIKSICNRRYGIGADGLLLLEKSKIADIKMRIFNADGSEAKMCGNGARCVALYSVRSQKPQTRKQIKIETKAGIIESEVKGDDVKIKLTDPKNTKLEMPIKVNNRTIRANFINIGVPHTVIFVNGLDEIDVQNIGRQIRFHERFLPEGTNVDFVEILDKDSIKVRTYERGVEDETLACGTGAVAAALITDYRLPITDYHKINVHTKSGEILKVYFEKIKNKFNNVWLEGKARIVYKGCWCDE